MLFGIAGNCNHLRFRLRFSPGRSPCTRQQRGSGSLRASTRRHASELFDQPRGSEEPTLQAGASKRGRFGRYVVRSFARSSGAPTSASQASMSLRAMLSLGGGMGGNASGENQAASAISRGSVTISPPA